jgi:hypothetical protein
MVPKVLMVLMIAGLLSGAVLGLRFRFWVLIPASCVFFFVTLVVLIADGESGWTLAIAIVFSIAVLQIGYIVGSASSIVIAAKNIAVLPLQRSMLGCGHVSDLTQRARVDVRDGSKHKIAAR